MYLPEAFAVDDIPKLQAFMAEFNFATLVTQHQGVLIASHALLVLDAGAGPYGRLRGHLAARNPQLEHLRAGGEALAIFLGPHGYISPSWYASPQNVPTWNYTAVHAYGRPRMLDRDELVTLLKDLVRQQEQSLDPPWDFDPQAGWIERMLPHIGGFAIPIERLEGKFKLNQNRAPGDRARLIEVLSSSPDPAQRHMAELIEAANEPKPKA